MKLFAFVRRARRPSSPVETVATPEPAAVALEDAAVPAEKRRRRPSSSGSAAWKPTLVAISEDATVAAKAKAKPAAAAAKAKAPARPSPRVARVDYDDFRHFRAPTVLPAFAPTAFLF